EDFLILLIPMVDEVPLEGRIRRERRRARQRLRIVPHRVFGAAIADRYRPETRRSAALVKAGVAARSQQVLANVAQRQVIDRDRRLDFDHRPRAVGDHDFVELDADAPRSRLEEDRWHGYKPSCRVAKIIALHRAGKRRVQYLRPDEWRIVLDRHWAPEQISL